MLWKQWVHLRVPTRRRSFMLHFPSYNEFLSEHAGPHHPLAGGLAVILMAAVAVLLFF